MDRLLIILLGIVVFLSGITYLLRRVFPRLKVIKYLPAIFCLFAGAYYLYLAKTVHVGFADLANAILAIMFLTGFVSGLLTCFIIDFVLPRFKS